MAKNEKHSQAFLGKYRDFWWNRDFLDLMAKRWNLRKTGSLADIGCGLGHWSRLLFPYLKSRARLVSVDLEPDYVKKAAAEFKGIFPGALPSQYSFLVGDATHLPLASNSFDAATCQTLLIHLKNPELALSEMMRIVKPGGLIICSEPNNVFSGLEFSSFTPEKSTELFVKHFEYILRYNRGKIALGDSDIWFGDFLPELFAKAGLRDIKVYQSDQAYPLIPPYRTKEQAIYLEQSLVWKKQGTGGWDRRLSQKRVLAGGGTEKFFNSMWRVFERDFKKFEKAIRQKNYYRTGGAVSYLVSGRKK